MGKKSRLSKKKNQVIEDLFENQFDEEVVLRKNHLSRKTYNQWLSSESFAAEFDQRIGWLQRHCQAMIAKYATFAAAKLVELIESEKQETARKACLDIISLPNLNAEKDNKLAKANPADTFECQGLSDETAVKLLKVLAEEKP